MGVIHYEERDSCMQWEGREVDLLECTQCCLHVGSDMGVIHYEEGDSCVQWEGREVDV